MMPECRYHQVCHLSDEADHEAQLCILHSKNPDKDTPAFRMVLEAHLRDKGYDCRWMVFPELDIFHNKTFSEGANFQHATFYSVDFDGAKFSKRADFFNDRFFERIDFDGAQFCERAVFKRDYERAGDFHYGEKEMRRQNCNETPRALRWLLWLYKVVSGYGERALPPLIGAGLVLLLFAGLYMWFELSPTSPNPNKVPPLALTDTKTRVPAIVYSLEIMTWQKPQLYTLSDSCPRILYTIQSLLGPLLFGLFALAIRQRMKR